MDQQALPYMVSIGYPPLLIMVLLQGLCYVVDITMVFLTFIGIFDFVFHLVELSRVDERGLLLPYRTVPGIYC